MLQLVSSQKQTQTISNEQVQALDILAFSTQELERFLMEEYYDNPMLEQTSPTGGQTTLFNNLNDIYQQPFCSEQTYGDDYYDREEYTREMASQKSYTLTDLVKEQISFSDLNESEAAFVNLCLETADTNGYLSIPKESIAMTVNASPETAEKMLYLLQHLEPSGLFTENTADYFLFQLKEQGMEDELLFDVVRNHLWDLLSGNYSVITGEYSLSGKRLKTYLQIISQLNPHPISAVSSEPLRYQVPDVLVSRPFDYWEVQINDQWMGSFETNSYYASMIQTTTDPQLKEYFRQKYKRALFILECVEKRRTTIQKTIHSILNFQEDFFLNGAPLRPMTLSVIADDLGISESTVHRAVKYKTLQYKTIYRLEDLFSVASTADAEFSQKAILDELKSLIEHENKKKPLSDNKLATLLEEKGITVSRRAITKYREKLGIPDSRHRF